MCAGEPLPGTKWSAAEPVGNLQQRWGHPGSALQLYGWCWRYQLLGWMLVTSRKCSQWWGTRSISPHQRHARSRSTVLCMVPARFLLHHLLRCEPGLQAVTCPKLKPPWRLTWTVFWLHCMQRVMGQCCSVHTPSMQRIIKIQFGLCCCLLR